MLVERDRPDGPEKVINGSEPLDSADFSGMRPSEPGNDTSSIGPTWPPERSSFRRIKGIFDRRFIETTPDLEHVVDVLESLRSTSIDVPHQNPEEDITRVSIRAVIRDDLLAQSASQPDSPYEAVIPLSGGSDHHEGFSMVYLGRNRNTRASDPEDFKRALANLGEALSKQPSSYEEITARVISSGYTLDILTKEAREADPETLDQMGKLYERFNWGSEDVRAILGNPNSVIGVARKDGHIVSAGIAEMVALNFGDGHTLRMAEITEAATQSGYGGQGLYSGVASELMAELHRKSMSGDGEPIDLIYGECNGNEPGVLKAARSQGRTFSFEVSKVLRLPVKGYLPQHVPIEGAERKTPYNDLFPSFASLSDIANFVGSVK